jgi:hypothetical protein
VFNGRYFSQAELRKLLGKVEGEGDETVYGGGGDRGGELGGRTAEKSGGKSFDALADSAGSDEKRAAEVNISGGRRWWLILRETA